MMVYSRIPHVYTCVTDNTIMIDDKSPGSLNEKSELIKENNFKYFLNNDYPMEIEYGHVI